MCYRSKNIHTTERQLQIIFKTGQQKRVLNFQSLKTTVCMHFCQLRKTHDDPALTLDGTPTTVVEETKFSGVMFD